MSNTNISYSHTSLSPPTAQLFLKTSLPHHCQMESKLGHQLHFEYSEEKDQHNCKMFNVLENLERFSFTDTYPDSASIYISIFVYVPVRTS